MDPENRIKTPLLFFSWVYMDTFIDSRRSSSSPKGVQFCNCSPPILPFQRRLAGLRTVSGGFHLFLFLTRNRKISLNPLKTNPITHQKVAFWCFIIAQGRKWFLQPTLVDWLRGVTCRLTIHAGHGTPFPIRKSIPPRLEWHPTKKPPPDSDRTVPQGAWSWWILSIPVYSEYI